MKYMAIFIISILIAQILCIKKNEGNSTKFGKKPNIMLIVSADHPLNAISLYPGSNGNFKTPNIDRIANHGMKFTNAFTTNSLSGPSNAGMFTGKMSHDKGN